MDSFPAIFKVICTFSCGFGVVEKECNDSATWSMKYYSSFWPFGKVFGFGMVFFVGLFYFFVGFFWGLAYSVEKLEIKKSEDEKVEWKMMFSEIFAVLETRVSSPPHILCSRATPFPCIDLCWKYFGHIKKAWKNQRNKSESSLIMGNMLLEVSYFSLIRFPELCASLCRLHNSGNRHCGERDVPVTSF